MWRAVATGLLLLLLGALVTPFAQAEDPENGMPPCCRAMVAGHAACSMRMHHAVQQHDHTHQFASLQERCPCTPMPAPNVAPHDAPLAVSAAGQMRLPLARAPSGDDAAWNAAYGAGFADTRGPPLELIA